MSDEIEVEGAEMPPVAPLSRGNRLIILLGSAALVALHLALSWRNYHPSVVFDEEGYLGNARLLAGGARWDMPYAPFYRSGYSVVIAPAVKAFDTGSSQWRAVHVVNAVLLATLLPLLVAILRRVFATPPRRAIAIAAVGAVTPAVLASGVSAIAENLVLPLVLVAVLGAVNLGGPASGRRITRAIPWFGLAVGALYGTHPRFTLVVPVAIGLVAWGAWRALVPRRRAAVELGALAVAVAGSWALDRHVRQARWTSGVEHLEGGPKSWWNLISSWHGLNELLLSTVGQVWYLVVGSVGLVAVGVAVVVARARATHEEPGTTLALRFLLAMAGVVFATSVLFFAQNHFRADHYVYGRHNDTFTPLWVTAALLLVVGPAQRGAWWRRTPWKAVAASGAMVATVGLFLSLTRDPADIEAAFSPFAVPAITRFIGNRTVDAFWLSTAISVPMVAALAGLTWLGGRTSRVGRVAVALVPLLLGGWFLAAGWDGIDRTERFQHAIYREWDAPADLERLGITEISVDASSVRAFTLLSYPWYLPDVDVRSYDAADGDDPPTPFALADSTDPARREAGDRIVYLDHGTWYFLWENESGLALWVRKGPEQDRLAAEGKLLPAGFPGPLPTEARKARIELAAGQATTVTVRSGKSAPVRVDVTHTGSGSPWPDYFSYGLKDRVRVKADVQPLDPGGETGARSGGELHRWMLPGDERAVTVDIQALTAFLAPLPPGRYRVQLGLGQEGEDWFTSGGPKARFTLVVTG